MFPFLLQNPAPLIFASLHTLPLCLSRSTDGAHTLRPSFSPTCPPRSLLHHYLQPTTPYHLILLRSNRFASPVHSLFAVVSRVSPTSSITFTCFLFSSPHLRSLTAVITQTFFCSSHFRDTIPPFPFLFQHRHPLQVLYLERPKIPESVSPEPPISH